MKTKCGYVAIIGSPNAGKSTLLNNLLGTKISIVSPKVQTTRNIINGIVMHKEAQLIFIDTPGIFNPSKKLEQQMVKLAWRQTIEADRVALLIDSKTGLDKNNLKIIERLKEQGIKTDVILNKIDLVKPTRLLELAEQLHSYQIFDKFFMISALNGSGVEDLKEHFKETVPFGPYLYPEDEITTIPERFIAQEVVREQLFLNLFEELPYNLTVEVETWEEMDDGSTKINLLIFTSRESNKNMIIGKKGSMLKKIGSRAREELSLILNRKVHIFLFVKVKEDWQDKQNLEMI